MQESADGLTLAEAAEQLGVSADTVRRRIQRGELRAWQVATKFGPAWRVVPGGLPGDAQPLADGLQGGLLPPVQGAELVRALDLVDKLQQQNLELAGRVGYYQAEVEQLRTTLKALQAPSPEPEPASPAPDAVETPPPTELFADSTKNPPRRWWQRVLFG